MPTVLVGYDAGSRRATIEGILAQGHAVGFRNTVNGIFKVATRFELNAEGDMICDYTTGRALEVAWDSSQYDIEDLGAYWSPPN